MNSATGAPRRTLREFVRRLFACRGLVLTSAFAGLLAGSLHAWRQPKTFAGFLELAAGATTSGPPAIRLPDAVQLRRMVLEPRVVRALLPADAEGLDAEEPPGLLALQRSIDVKPLPTAAGADRSVYRVLLEVPAADWQSARQQMRLFADRLQAEFEGAGIVRRATPRSPERDVAVVPVGFFEWTDELENRAKALGTTLDRVEESLSKLRQELAERRNSIAALDKSLAERSEAIRIIETDKSLARAPASVLQANPPAAEAVARAEETRVKLAGLASKVTPSHPSYGAAKRQADQARLAAEQQAVKLLAKLKDEAAALSAAIGEKQDESKRLDASVAAFDRLLRDKKAHEVNSRLGTPATRKSAEVESKAKQPEMPSAPVGRPANSGTASASPTPPPQPLPMQVVQSASAPAARPGKLLVAGPFVEPQAVRPRWLHDMAFGLFFGTMFGLFLAIIRGGADQRVHTPNDLETLGLGIEVFGSVPQLDRGPPVQIVRGSGMGN